MGCFAEIGWAWNMMPPVGVVGLRRSRIPSAEFVESFVIFLYGATNVFLEHLAAWGSAWSAQDLEHISITIMFFGGGLLSPPLATRSHESLTNKPQVRHARRINPHPLPPQHLPQHLPFPPPFPRKPPLDTPKNLLHLQQPPPCPHHSPPRPHHVLPPPSLPRLHHAAQTMGHALHRLRPRQSRHLHPHLPLPSVVISAQQAPERARCEFLLDKRGVGFYGE